MKGLVVATYLLASAGVHEPPTNPTLSAHMQLHYAGLAQPKQGPTVNTPLYTPQGIARLVQVGIGPVEELDRILTAIDQHQQDFLRNGDQKTEHEWRMLSDIGDGLRYHKQYHRELTEQIIGRIDQLEARERIFPGAATMRTPQGKTIQLSTMIQHHRNQLEKIKDNKQELRYAIELYNAMQQRILERYGR